MMNNKKIIVPILILLGFQISFAQTDTLINYNPNTGEIYTYSPVSTDTSKAFDHTERNYGTESGFDILELEAPDSTYNNSGFTELAPVQNLYSIFNYPTRTAIKLFFVKNDTLKQRCSGILVASNYVLTDCHCVGIYDTNRTLIFYDTVLVFPAFDNGIENSVFGSTIAVEYITFKSNLQGSYSKDIALIKLKENLGDKTGWVGIAFSKEDSYFEDRVFHKFSYPMERDLSDTTRIYNGDTLYYNYGTLDLINDDWLGYSITGIPGQSGSSLIYTNNDEYYSFGTQVWSHNSRHIRISPEVFYAFKSVINNGISNVGNDKGMDISYGLSEAYPNPFNPTTKISYIIPNSGFVQLDVYDILGRVVQTLVHEIQTSGKYEITFTATGLSSGVYFYRMQCGDFSSTKKLIILR